MDENFFNEALRHCQIKVIHPDRCPHYIFEPSHYREDGSCKCDDPAQTHMVEWGYEWSEDEQQ